MIKILVLLAVLFCVDAAIKQPFETDVSFAVGDVLQVSGITDGSDITINVNETVKNAILLKFAYYDEKRIDVTFETLKDGVYSYHPESTFNSFPRSGNVNVFLSFTEFGVELAVGKKNKFVRILNYKQADYPKLKKVNVHGFKELNVVSKL